MKKNFKRVLAFSMCVAMIGLCACGKKGGDENTTTTAPVEDEDGKVISVHSVIDYADKVKEPLSFEGMAAAESDLYVEPVKGITDEFMRGVDVSSYISEIDSGVVYKDFNGKELKDYEFFNMLADCGVNWVRIRVWNDPYNSDGMGYGGGNNDVEKAIVMGKLATDAGMKVLIDFHYSDFWADPGKQDAPKEWAHATHADKVTKLAEFTKESLNKIIDAGVNVAMVQVGNETNNGMAGASMLDQEERVLELMKSGCNAVREISKDILVAVHFTNAHESGFPDYAGKLIDAGVDYDVFAASYYPYWHGTLEKLESQLTKIKDTYKKDVMVVETSYLYTGENGDGHANSVNPDTEGIDLPYEISMQGQANEVRDVMQTVVNVGGLGVFYWEPAWVPVQYYAEDDPNGATIYEENKVLWEKYGSGWASSHASKYDPDDAGVYFGGCAWDNQAMFDMTGKPMESLNVFKYVFSGTTAKKTISSVPDLTFESGIGAAVKLPETVDAIMVDGSRSPIPVVWDAAQIAAAEKTGAGVYTIDGVATGEGKEYKLVCNLEIKKINYIKNPGFEDAGMTEWVIDTTGVNKKKPSPSREEDNNWKSGKACLHFYCESAYAYTVSQKIENIPAGTYELIGFLQGGSADSATFELCITVNGTEYKASAKAGGWKVWDDAIVSNVEIPDGAEVVVEIRGINVPAKGWGAWDDLTLCSMN